MNKKYLKFLILLVVILVIGLLLTFYFINKKEAIHLGTTPQSMVTEIKGEPMTEAEKNSLGLYHLGNYEVFSRDESGKPLTFKMLSLNDEKDIAVPEFMSDTEKESREIPLDYKIQILERDASATITAYKVINRDEDIVNKY